MMQQEKTPLPGGQAIGNGVKQSDINTTTSTGKGKSNLDVGGLVDNFKQAIVRAGMTPPEYFTPGKIERFSATGGKDHDAWGVFFLNPDRTAGGKFGDWSTGLSESWFSNGNKTLSTDQRRKINGMLREAKEKYETELKEKHWAAAIEARKIWDNATPAPPGHPYLEKKGIKPHGARCQGKALIVPVLDAGSVICSLQRILPDGQKRFLPGGKTQGGRYYIGKPTGADQFYICEGFATGASIHEATGKLVIVAFNAGNLGAVAQHISKLYPDQKIIIAGDNDAHEEPNTGKLSAEKAARAIGAGVVLPHFEQPGKDRKDFNDLHRMAGLEAVREQLSKPQPGVAWEEPILLENADAPFFSSQLLPGVLGAMGRDVAASTETPLELAAGLSIAVLAAACQGKFQVLVKPGYFEPVNIWINAVLGSGNRKSAVLRQVTAPLLTWERLKRDELASSIRETETRLENQKARIKSLRGKYGKAKAGDLESIEAEILEIEKNLIEVPSFPKIWAQDVTPEHLGTLMADHNERMSILSAEGGIFDILNGRYSNGIPNLDLFLQSHAGDSVRVDRGSRDPVYLDRPALTLGLSTQPEVLVGLIDKPGFRGRGLLGRFLFLLPKSNLGSRTLETQPVPEATENKYHSLVSSLLNIELPQDDQGKPQPYILNMARNAYQEWLDFAKVIEADMLEGGRFEYVQDWAGKLPGAAARIAGLLHCAENPHQPWGSEINLGTMDRALELAAIFAGHALIAFDMMGADKSLEQARKIWRWIERNKHQSFSQRDCFNDLRGSFHKVANMKEPFGILKERNYIRETKRPEKVGRPSVQYQVNPGIIERWS